MKLEIEDNDFHSILTSKSEDSNILILTLDLPHEKCWMYINTDENRHFVFWHEGYLTTTGYSVITTVVLIIIALTTDVSLDFPRINVPQVVPQDDLQVASITILFRLDSIAQEMKETFTLTFFFRAGEFGPNPTLRNTFSGVVVDATSKKYENSYMNLCFCVFIM